MVNTIERAQASLAILQENSYQIKLYEYAMAHSVCPAEIDDIRAFILQALSN